MRCIKPEPEDVEIDASVSRHLLEDCLDRMTLPSPEEYVEDRKVAAAVQRAMRKLRPFEAAVLRTKYGLGSNDERPTREIADMFDLTRARIYQVEAMALSKLRNDPRLVDILNGLGDVRAEEAMDARAAESIRRDSRRQSAPTRSASKYSARPTEQPIEPLATRQDMLNERYPNGWSDSE